MSDFISREAAIKYAEHAYHKWNLAMAAADGKREINLVYKRQELCKAVESVFRDTPAADVAPVVRCKSCANRGTTDSGRLYCKRPLGMYGDIPVDADSFCSNGKYQVNAGAPE